MPQSFTTEFKRRIVHLYEAEGRTYKSITAEYGVSKASISKRCRELREECQNQGKANPKSPTEIDLMEDNLRLRRWQYKEMPGQSRKDSLLAAGI